MDTYLNELVDPAWALAPEALAAWLPADVVEVKLGRLVDDLKAHWWAEQIPRRLGQVSAEALALDKRRCRASVNVLNLLVRGWARLCPTFIPTDPARVPPDLRARGAQLDWERWVVVTAVDARDDRAAAVTAALQAGQRRWANQVAWLYTRELDELWRILAELGSAPPS